MIMTLPQEYSTPYADVVGGNLYLYDVSRYNGIIYDLTYLLKKSHCIYCGKKLQTKYKNPHSTLDHMYPRATGGVSITDNLAICCSNCNSEKGPMTVHEYLNFLSLSHNQRVAYRKNILASRKKVFKSTGFVIPTDWVEMYNVASMKQVAFSSEKNQHYDKIVEFYNKYHHLPYPVVIDNNGVILYNHNAYLFACDENLKQIPVIRLENVFYKKKKRRAR